MRVRADRAKSARFAGIFETSTLSTRVDNGGEKESPPRPSPRSLRAFRARSRNRRPVDNLRSRAAPSILAPAARSGLSSLSSTSCDEADLPAKRAPPEAEARLPRADVDACRPRDPQAPPRPRAASGCRRSHRRARAVQRRHRLSRSRDFDAVYRQGRSVSTRFLVLYWFPREDGAGEPRLGLAVPRATGGAVVRNRIKRQLREVWRALLARRRRGQRLRADRPAGPARGGRGARPRVAARARGRGAREGGGMRYLGDRARVRLALQLRAAARRRARCKYHPSCSQYALDALRKHGLVRGSLLAGWRLLRCNPWSHGGVDHVTAARARCGFARASSRRSRTS